MITEENKNTCCTICYQELLITTPSHKKETQHLTCKHAFHKGCLDKLQATLGEGVFPCPTCRTLPLPPPDTARAVTRVRVLVLIERTKEVVLVQHHILGWRFPGGAIELHDASFKHAAQRGLFEETGMWAGSNELAYIGELRQQAYFSWVLSDDVLEFAGFNSRRRDVDWRFVSYSFAMREDKKEIKDVWKGCWRDAVQWEGVHKGTKEMLQTVTAQKDWW